MARCANPRCGREVRQHPVHVTVAGATLVYGPTCARNLGLIQPRAPAPPKPRPRPLDLTAHEIMQGQLDLLDELVTT